MGKINLKNLLETYKSKLCNRTFKYTIRNKTKQTDEVIMIHFYTENLCHLLGLQHVYNESQVKYFGSSGYKLIEEEKLTIKSLKQHNSKGYNYIKLKLSHFNEIYDVLNKGKLIAFNKFKAFPKTKITADFLLYKDGEAYILHLFLIQEYDNYYSPISFIVQSQNDKYPLKYIQNQTHKTIIDFQEIPNSL